MKIISIPYTRLRDQLAKSWRQVVQHWHFFWLRPRLACRTCDCYDVSGIDFLGGCSKSDVYCRPMPKVILTSVGRLVSYLWTDELEDYLSSDGTRGHIFRDIEVVDTWLNHAKTPYCCRCPASRGIRL
jgi:hypothetical protein